jgi:putative addiction module antidote
MTLESKLRRIGNSLGVVLPKEALTHLNAEEGDTLMLTNGADGTLRLLARDPEVARQLERAEDIMRRYRETLRELAK